MPFPLPGNGLLFLKLSIAMCFLSCIYNFKKSSIRFLFKILFLKGITALISYLFSRVPQSLIISFHFSQVLLIIYLCLEQCLL